MRQLYPARHRQFIVFEIAPADLRKNETVRYEIRGVFSAKWEAKEWIRQEQGRGNTNVFYLTKMLARFPEQEPLRTVISFSLGREDLAP